MATPRRQGGALLRRLRERLAESQLSGDAGMPAGRLDEAAEFLLDAASVRRPGQAKVVIRTAPGAKVTRIAVINRDMPFLVDSIAATVAAERLSIDVLLHPLVSIRRDSAGRL